MGDRHGVRVSGSAVEIAGAVRSESCHGCSKDSRESSQEAPHAKLLVCGGVEDARVLPRGRSSNNGARRSTSSCSVCSQGSERKELENGRWTARRSDDAVTASFGFAGSSFRSEDSEALALWEEKSTEKSPKAVSSSSRLKPPDSSYSPWLKKIESLSNHVFSRSSPVHPKVDIISASFESPRSSIEYVKKGGGRISWRDHKFASSSPARSSTETALHNSPKARYSNASFCRVMMSNDQLERSPQSSPAPPPPAIKLRHGVSSSAADQLQFGPSAAATLPVDHVNLSRQLVDDEGKRSPWRSDSSHEKRTSQLRLSQCGQSPFQPERLLDQSTSAKPKESDVLTGKGCTETQTRIYSLNLHETEGTLDNVRHSCAAVAASGRQQQSAQVGVEAVSEICSSMNRTTRSHSMDEAMLNVCASGADVQGARAAAQDAGERKLSHRYYQRVTSRERSSRWGSGDDNRLDHIDFVAPSAARFLEDEGCVSPGVKAAPIKAAGAVPFKWEKEPGKPIEDNSAESAHDSRISALQLPPRLAPQTICSSPLRNRYIHKSMSAPLAELYPNYSSWESEPMKTRLPAATESVETGKDSRPASNSERAGVCKRVAIEPPIARDIRSAPQTLPRLAAGGDAGGQGGGAAQRRESSGDALRFDHKRIMPAHQNSCDVRPTSPTSILCGPSDGSHPSSNPSLSSEHDAPLTSATAASTTNFQCSSSLPSYTSFDSMEHSIDRNSELMSPESSLTSPLRANTRCNSMTYTHEFDHMGADSGQKGASRSANPFVRFCKTGKRWVKTKAHSKLGTIYSPEVRAPGIALQLNQGGANSDFSSRLGRLPTSKIGHSHVQRHQRRFAPSTSALLYEGVGDRSPAYAATLELLSPIERFSSKKTSKNRQTKPPPRPTRKISSRMRVKVGVRARFLVPMRRILRTLISKCTFRRRKKNVKAAESVKPLYWVDYTLCQTNF